MPVLVPDVSTLERRAAELAKFEDLRGLTERLGRLAAPLIAEKPFVPSEKAQLTRDGGWCRRDGSRLAFDPSQPREHRCPLCGAVYEDQVDYEAWLLWYHLWLVERAVHLSLLGMLDDSAAAVDRATDILREYADRYYGYPARDCVLGPSRLFFSTYLESIWLIGFVSAADLLGMWGHLTPELGRSLRGVAQDALERIAEFDEGGSNRQVWHDAAQLAAGAFLDDRERVERSASALAARVRHGFGREGMWYEGENYHFFALRGAVLGAKIAAVQGIDLFSGFGLHGWLGRALEAPLFTLLPDFTFPARRDSPYGVSIRQPRFAELWELAFAQEGAPSHPAFLRSLYEADEGAIEDRGFQDVAEVERNLPGGRLRRTGLSWKALLWMRPTLPVEPEEPRSYGSALLEDQGVAILRRSRDRSYLSLEFGDPGGGHGHPDRLHVSYWADGRPWLADFGTGSYVHDDLFWYRSTLAHNAPMIDGESQRYAKGTCLAFDDRGDWGWCRGELASGALAPGVRVVRTVVRGPGHLLDLVEVEASQEVTLTVPWHVLGDLAAQEWEPVDRSPFRPSSFVHGVERLAGPSRTVTGEKGAWTLAAAGPQSVAIYRALAPGPPTEGDRPFVALATRGQRISLGAAFSHGDSCTLEHVTDRWVVRGGDGREVTYGFLESGEFECRYEGRQVRLGGLRERSAPAPSSAVPKPERRTFTVPPAPSRGRSFSLDGPQDYRRAERPYVGAADFSARGRLWWTSASLELEIEVRKARLVLYDPGRKSMRLDNEPPDIHADGVQVYVRWPGRVLHGHMVVPIADGTVRSRVVGTVDEVPDTLQASWHVTDAGYSMRLSLVSPDPLTAGLQVGFDCLINEMWPERRRRAGQLAWAGGGDWVWLAGDRRADMLLGTLTLG